MDEQQEIAEAAFRSRFGDVVRVNVRNGFDHEDAPVVDVNIIYDGKYEQLNGPFDARGEIIDKVWREAEASPGYPMVHFIAKSGAVRPRRTPGRRRRGKRNRSSLRWSTSAKRRSRPMAARRWNGVLADDAAGRVLQGGAAGSGMVPHALARRRKVLKSGCEVEEIAHRTAERLERAVTVNAAWRLAILLGRETPELPAEVMFSDVEIGVLRDFAADRKLPEPLDLSAAVLTMAMGYRKHDGPPGYKMIWVGNSRLTIMAQAYELRNRVAADEPHEQLRSDKLATKGKGAPPASAREGPATTPLAGAKLDLPGDLFSVFRARLAADGGIPQKPGKRGARPRL